MNGNQALPLSIFKLHYLNKDQLGTLFAKLAHCSLETLGVLEFGGGGGGGFSDKFPSPLPLLLCVHCLCHVQRPAQVLRHFGLEIVG